MERLSGMMSYVFPPRSLVNEPSLPTESRHFLPFHVGGSGRTVTVTSLGWSRRQVNKPALLLEVQAVLHMELMMSVSPGTGVSVK